MCNLGRNECFDVALIALDPSMKDNQPEDPTRYVCATDYLNKIEKPKIENWMYTSG